MVSRLSEESDTSAEDTEEQSGLDKETAGGARGDRGRGSGRLGGSAWAGRRRGGGGAGVGEGEDRADGGTVGGRRVGDGERPARGGGGGGGSAAGAVAGGRVALGDGDRLGQGLGRGRGDVGLLGSDQREASGQDGDDALELHGV